MKNYMLMAAYFGFALITLYCVIQLAHTYDQSKDAQAIVCNESQGVCIQGYGARFKHGTIKNETDQSFVVVSENNASPIVLNPRTVLKIQVAYGRFAFFEKGNMSYPKFELEPRFGARLGEDMFHEKPPLEYQMYIVMLFICIAFISIIYKSFR